MPGPLPAPVRRSLGRGFAFALAGTMLAASVARGAEVVAAEVEGSANQITVEQGQTVTFPLSVRATGDIRCTATPDNPATATFPAAHAIDADGVVSAAAAPTVAAVFHAGPSVGSSCQVTWPGEPAPQELSMTVHADVNAPLGDHAFWLRPSLFTPPGSGDRLQDRTRTMLTFTVVPGSDLTPPEVSCDGPHATPGNDGWNLSPVSYGCSAHDDGSGLAEEADAAFTLQSTGQGTVWTDERTVRDQAGNETTVGPFGPHLVDLEDPVAEIGVPAEGQSFLLGEAVEPTYACMDSASGVGSCQADALDTSSVGTKTFWVHATDRAGRAASVARTYHVVYDFAWEPPFFDGRDHTAGASVPVAWHVDGDAAGTSLVGVSTEPCGGGASVQAIMSGRSPVAQDPGSGRYRMVWKTDRRWSGSCRALQIHLDDGTTRTGEVTFR